MNTHFNIIILSKNKRVGQNFFVYLKKFLLTNFNYKKKIVKKSNKKSLMSILKAPNINKVAQEQFGMTTYLKKLKLEISQTFKFIILLKKLWFNGFPEVGLKITFEVQEKPTYQILKSNNFVVLQNYMNKSYEKRLVCLKLKISRFLVILDICGKHVKFKNSYA